MIAGMAMMACSNDEEDDMCSFPVQFVKHEATITGVVSYDSIDVMLEVTDVDNNWVSDSSIKQYVRCPSFLKYKDGDIITANIIGYIPVPVYETKTSVCHDIILSEVVNSRSNGEREDREGESSVYIGL